MNRVLMIAFHFPPLAGSSGIQRTLRFAQHLPKFDWQPLVLSASPRAYERVSSDLNADILPGTVVRRAFALDTARHLSVSGRYVGAMARPDRWVSWRFDGVRQGLQMIRKYKPTVIWSTYPIATAHLIGAELHRRTGIPWVADFRDPMAQEGYPADPLTWEQYRQIEQMAMTQATRCVFTTPGAAAYYRHLHPEAAARIEVIENGFDEETFTGLLASGPLGTLPPLVPGSLTLLHSGIVYPSERDPTQLMAALRRLHDAGAIRPGSLTVRFRAAVAEDLLRELAQRYAVEAYIDICPPIPYREALNEMMRADGLLIMQASNCNSQIPAKLYEYMRAGRPVLALTDHAGDTAAVLRKSGIEAIAALDNCDEIAVLIKHFISDDIEISKYLARPYAINSASRLHRAKELSRILNIISH
ncbi:MAG: glycosyltransferase [Cytophaga sp.]|nr:glycosyltransferase [Undibacterium sp.]